MTNEKAIALLRDLRDYQANRAELLKGARRLGPTRHEALDYVRALEHAITELGVLQMRTGEL